MPPPTTATRQQDDSSPEEESPNTTTPPRRSSPPNRRRSRRPTRVEASAAVQQNVSPLRSPPPYRTSSSPPAAAATARDQNDDDNNNNTQRRRRRKSNNNKRDKKRAEDWAKQLDAAIPILLDKLFAHLSRLPEEELQEMGGVTLPASALGWLTSQYNYFEDSPTATASPWASYTRDKLRLLRFLLPRITHLRITRTTPWPPPLLPTTTTSSSTTTEEENNNGTTNPTTPRHATTPPPLEFFQTTTTNTNTATGRTLSGGSSTSVCSALTMDTSFPTRQAFLDYMIKLQERPQMDLRLFPHLKVLVLDSVPPYWITHYFGNAATVRQLQVLRIEKACLYQLPEIFTLSEYPNLTYLRFSACCVGELSQLPKLLRRLPNLQFLSLADNQIRLEKTALKGLRRLTNLRKLDLSGNRLVGMGHANMFLGNITCLNVAGNALTNVKGIDKLYGLEVLDLSDNQIADFSCLVGLGKLPSLRELSVQGNPFLRMTPPGYKNNSGYGPSRMQLSSSSSPFAFEQEYRLLILSWFATSRGGGGASAIMQDDLPILHGKPVSEREITTIRAMCVHQKYIPSKATTTTATKIQKVQRKYERKGRAKIRQSVLDDPIVLQQQRGQHQSKSTMVLQPIQVSFTVHDVLNKLYQENRKTYPEEYETLVVATKTNNQYETEKAPIQEQKEEDEVPEASPEEEIPEEEDCLQEAATTDANSVVSSCDRQLMAKEDTVATSKMSDFSSTTEKEPDPVQEEEEEEESPSSSVCSDPNKENDEKEEGPEEVETRVLQVTSPAASPEKAPTTTGTPTISSNAVEGMDDDSELFLVEEAASPSLVDTSTERQLREAVSQLSLSLMLDAPAEVIPAQDQEGDVEKKSHDSQHDADTVITKDKGEVSGDDNKEEGILICDGAEENDSNNVDHTEKSPMRSSTTQPAAQKETEKTPPRLATLKLTSAGTRGRLDIFGAGWDELVELAAAGLIPDGRLKTPIANVPKDQPEEDIFAVADDELFGPVAPRVSKLEVDTSVAGASSFATDDVSAIGSMVRSITFDSAYQDDFSLPSFDTSELQVQSKFQLAEDNSKYDGPETCRNLNVLENMDLYFTSFVFRDTTPASIESESANGDLASSADQVHPRIQLWPEDRKSTREDEPSELGELSRSNRERCVRVWEEDVIPCGKSSLRRLGPNRNVRLTFHGDKVMKKSSVRPYSESRKVYLCLSSEALYVIARKDGVTLKKKRKKFPLPIRDKAKFSDAPWPHAIARHSYNDLQTIIIGFDFQRLTLRFSSRRRSDPYSYVLLTCNKRQTVSILQEIQNLKKELDQSIEDLTSDSTVVAIENDSQLVFDALSEAVAPNTVGTIIHYQIVQQFWKHGNRGTVRRVCIVSDTKLLLLNEDYLSDAHKSLSNDGRRVGEVSYEVVDEATLAQVAEVRPADADPRSITIVINPISRLSRTHRWRLLCRDSDGAERLVADVRRAVDMQSDDGFF